MRLFLLASAILSLAMLSPAANDKPAHEHVTVLNGERYGFHDIIVVRDAKGFGKIGVTHIGVWPPTVDYTVRLVSDKPAAKSSDAPVAAAKDDIPAGHRLLYKMARIRAAGELADKEKISRRAAREKIDDALTDAQLHELATTAGITIKPQVVGGKVSDFLDWLLAHSDAIIALVKIILALFQAVADVENSSIFMPHDWCGQLFAMAA